MNNYEVEVEKFRQSVFNSFKSNNYLDKFTSKINRYTGSQEKFIQTPVRISMKMADFDGRVDNTVLGDRLGESIARGELNYFIEQVKENQISEKIGEMSFGNFVKMLNKTGFRANYALIPIEYFNELHDFIKYGIVKYKSRGIYITYGGWETKVIFSNNYVKFDRIIFLGNNAINLTRKQSGESNIVANFPSHKRFSPKDSPIDARKEGYNFIFRSIFKLELNLDRIKSYKVTS